MEPVTTSAIYNTNVRFIDNTTLTRAQEGPILMMDSAR